MIKVSLVILALAALFSVALGNSGGYPVCDTNFGGGGPHGAASNALAPKVLKADGTPPTSADFKTTPLTLTLSGTAFTGYSFSASAGTVTAQRGQTACGGRGFTHTAAQRGPTPVVFTWTPPAATAAATTVTLRATILSGGNYQNLTPLTLTRAGTGGGGAASSTGGTKPPTPAPTPTDSSDSSSDSSESSDPTVTPSKNAADVVVTLALKLDVEMYPDQDAFADAFVDSFAQALGIDAIRIEVVSYTVGKKTKTSTIVAATVKINILNKNLGDDDEVVTVTMVNEALDAAIESETTELMAAITSHTAEAVVSNSGNSSNQPSKMSSGAVVAIVIVVLLVVIGGGGFYYWYSRKRNANFKSAAGNIQSSPAAPAAQTSTDGWTKVWDENTKHYYYFNSKTSESRWTPPPGVTF